VEHTVDPNFSADKNDEGHAIRRCTCGDWFIADDAAGVEKMIAEHQADPNPRH